MTLEWINAIFTTTIMFARLTGTFIDVWKQINTTVKDKQTNCSIWTPGACFFHRFGRRFHRGISQYGCNFDLLVSQRLPINPGRHSHVYELIPSTQVAPFRQGFEAHSSTSRKTCWKHYRPFVQKPVSLNLGQRQRKFRKENLPAAWWKLWKYLLKNLVWIKGSFSKFACIILVETPRKLITAKLRLQS